MYPSKDAMEKFFPTKETIGLSDLKKEIHDWLKKFPKRIVVYIDDIDRLESSEIRMIFKLVRLVADFLRVSYILAFDEEIVTKSLSNIYSEETETENKYIDAKKYIEKFIQVPMYLPKPDKTDLESFITEPN